MTGGGDLVTAAPGSITGHLAYPLKIFLSSTLTLITMQNLVAVCHAIWAYIAKIRKKVAEILERDWGLTH